MLRLYYLTLRHPAVSSSSSQVIHERDENEQAENDNAEFTQDFAKKLFWDAREIVDSASVVGRELSIKNSSGVSSVQFKAFLKETELWKNDTTTFLIPEINFEEAPGTARASSVADFLEETAEKLETAAGMFRGEQAKTLLLAATALYEIASGQCSDCYTLLFRDPSGRIDLDCPAHLSDVSANLVSRKPFALSWAQRHELGILTPLADQFFGEEAIEGLAQRITQSSRIVFFTGAGISTESGIPCYRGSKPAGHSYQNTWEKYDPSDELIQNFISKPDCRERYWRRTLDLQPLFGAARPNSSHSLPRILHEQGRLSRVITTNVDDLYEQANISPDKITYLHGVGHLSQCYRRCERSKTMPTSALLEDFGTKGYFDPLCEYCGTPLKPLTIAFGQPLELSLDPGSELFECIAGADLLIVMGSSLTVAPSNAIPAIALQAQVPLAIINLDQTQFDPFAKFVIQQTPCGEISQRILDKLSMLIDEN